MSTSPWSQSGAHRHRWVRGCPRWCHEHSNGQRTFPRDPRNSNASARCQPMSMHFRADAASIQQSPAAPAPSYAPHQRTGNLQPQSSPPPKPKAATGFASVVCYFGSLVFQDEVRPATSRACPSHQLSQTPRAETAAALPERRLTLLRIVMQDTGPTAAEIRCAEKRQKQVSGP